MAILIDARAREVIARRRNRRRSAAVNVHIARLSHGTHALLAEWATRRGEKQHETWAGDIQLFVDSRVARYARWRDISISAQRIGPFHYLIVENELPVLLDLADWHRRHPGVNLDGAHGEVPVRMTA
jgi:hypothetical protein